MLTKRYLVTTKNLNPILKKIVDGVAPAKFTTEHLKSIGFGSSNDPGNYFAAEGPRVSIGRRSATSSLSCLPRSFAF